MPSPHEMESQQRELEQHERNLRFLEEQSAIYGAGLLPLSLHNQIQNEIKVIQRLKKNISIGQEVELKNRRNLLLQIKRLWGENFLGHSIHSQLLRIYQTTHSARPWEMTLRINKDEFALPNNVRVVDIFERYASLDGLIIRGGRGMGKTTLLLELAIDLADISLNDTSHPIPIVLNITSWTFHRKKIF